MTAPKGNKYASKPASQRRSSVVSMRAKRKEKDLWVYAAARKGVKLAEWVVEHLNAAALRECGESASKRRPR